MSTAPGPRGSLLLGMARELRRDQVGTLQRTMTAYGDVALLAAGPPGRRARFHLVTHPDGVPQVLAGNAGNYVKDSRFYRELAAAVGDGLLTSDGERWRRQRRTLAPLFAHGRIGGYVPVMADEAVRLRRRWNAIAGSPARVNLHAEMVEYTLRVVGRALFGAALDEVAPTVRATFPVLSEQVRRRASAALPPPGRHLTSAQRALYATVDVIVDRRRRAAGDGDGDLVSLLLAARDPRTGAPLSTQEVRDQLLIFLIAGARDHRHRADLRLVPARPPPGRAAARPPGARRGPRRQGPHRRGGGPAGVHRHGGEGGAAAVPTGLGLRPAQRGRRSRPRRPAGTGTPGSPLAAARGRASAASSRSPRPWWPPPSCSPATSCAPAPRPSR